MDKTQKSLNLIAVFAFLLVIAAVAVGESFVAFTLIALLIAALLLNKNSEDHKAALPVIGAGSLYFGYKVVASVFWLLEKIVDQIREWKLEGLKEKLEDMAITSDKYEDLAKDYKELSESISKDTFGDVLDVILFIVALVVIALAVLAILNILSKKDFSKVPVVGKIAVLLCGEQAAAANAAWFCPQCGTQVKGDFCSNCGQKKP